MLLSVSKCLCISLYVVHASTDKNSQHFFSFSSMRFCSPPSVSLPSIHPEIWRHWLMYWQPSVRETSPNASRLPSWNYCDSLDSTHSLPVPFHSLGFPSLCHHNKHISLYRSTEISKYLLVHKDTGQTAWTFPSPTQMFLFQPSPQLAAKYQTLTTTRTTERIQRLRVWDYIKHDRYRYLQMHTNIETNSMLIKVC